MTSLLDLDLSFLSNEEILHIKEVLLRSKGQVEHGADVLDRTEDLHHKSDDIIQIMWKERHHVTKYLSGYDIVTAALPKFDYSATDTCIKNDETASSPEKQNEDRNSSISNHIFQAVLNDILEEIEKQVKENNGDEVVGGSDSCEGDVFVPDDKSPRDVQNTSAKVERKESWLAKKLKWTKSKDETDEKMSIPSSAEANSASKHSSSGDETQTDMKPNEETNLESSDSSSQQSMGIETVSKTVELKTNEGVEADTSGMLDISITYFPAEQKIKTPCPQPRSRSSKSESTDVISRKDYVLLTGSKLSILKGNESGAREEDDGELHIEIRGAHDLTLASGILKNKSRTYVKCYMIPDRFHAAKMRSVVVKETSSPKYNHQFIYRGFNKNEFEGRSFEILVCGLTYTIGKAVVVGGIRLCSRSESNDPKLGSNEKELSLWKQAFEHPSKEATAFLALRQNIKPTY